MEIFYNKIKLKIKKCSGDPSICGTRGIFLTIRDSDVDHTVDHNSLRGFLSRIRELH